MVSVAMQLGLHDDSELLMLAEQEWGSWRYRFPCLAGVADVKYLRDWLCAARPAAADEVFHVLVTLASPSDGDEVSAAKVVAWALLPGASAVAHRLRTLSP